MPSKKNLSERDICTKFINPAFEKAVWDIKTQIREEVSFANGRIIVEGGFEGACKLIRFYINNVNNKPVG